MIVIKSKESDSRIWRNMKWYLRDQFDELVRDLFDEWTWYRKHMLMIHIVRILDTQNTK